MPSQLSGANRRKRRIVQSFGRARQYERQALVQAKTASGLAKDVAALGLPSKSRALEIGCGTGLLSREFLARLDLASFLCSDLSLAMLRRCRSALAGACKPRPDFALMDAEEPGLKPGFDLVASSLALQWTSDFAACLAGLFALLRPGGWLALAVPGPETFSQWREACAALELPCGLLDFPSPELLRKLLPQAGERRLREADFTVRYPDAISFPRYLKSLGANVAAAGTKPLDPGSFKRLLRCLEENSPNGLEMTYQVIFACYRKG